MLGTIIKNKGKIALGVIAILVTSIAISVIIYRDSTELRGDIRYKKINTTKEEYAKMERTMESYVISKLNIGSMEIPDVAVAPTMISDDTYTHFSTDKEKIRIEVKPDKEGKPVEQLKLESLTYFEGSLLGVYINEKGILRTVIAELSNGSTEIHTSDDKECIMNKDVLIPLRNSEAEWARTLREIVETELLRDSEHKNIDRYFNSDSKNEFKSAMEQVRESLVDGEYNLEIVFGKSRLEDVGKDRIYMRLCNIGIGKGVVDMMLKLDINNQVFDVDVL